MFFSNVFRCLSEMLYMHTNKSPVKYIFIRKLFTLFMYKVFCEIEIKCITDIKSLTCNGCLH